MIWCMCSNCDRKIAAMGLPGKKHSVRIREHMVKKGDQTKCVMSGKIVPLSSVRVVSCRRQNK